MLKINKNLGVFSLKTLSEPLQNRVPRVRVLLPLPVRVFITDLSYEHSFFIQILLICMREQVMCLLTFCFYADFLGIYSTSTPMRVSAL